MSKKKPTTIKLSQLHLYPLKSAKGISLNQVWVEETGLSFDRSFMLADFEGRFITGRTEPKISMLSISLHPRGIRVSHANMSPLVLNYDQFSLNEVQTSVFKDDFISYTTHSTANAWFSHLLNRPVQCLYISEKSKRIGQKAQTVLSFADEYPLLLLSEASLAALNERTVLPHKMAQFRPNLVVTGCEAFEEDAWEKIRIGSVEFFVAGPCSRCVFTTLDLNTHQYRDNQEPLQTLRHFRTDEKGKINFGMNLIALNQGQLSLDDPIEVISYRQKEIYSSAKTEQAQTITSSMPLVEQSNVSSSCLVTFEDEIFSCDNKRVLLTQMEEKGVSLDHRCRAGICGRCKIKLIEGEVVSRGMPALSIEEKTDGVILSCCSVPKTNIKLERC